MCSLCSEQDRNAISVYTHMSVVRSPQNLSLLRVCASSLLLSRTDSRGESPDPPHKKAGVRLKFLLSRSLSFTHSHAHTDARTQTQSYSVLDVSRQPAAGVWRQGAPLCWTPPLLLRLWPPLLGDRLAVKSEPTACLSAPTSIQPRHKIPLIRLHLLWHRDLPLAILLSFPLFSPYSS